jgi:hypothetical protein
MGCLQVCVCLIFMRHLQVLWRAQDSRLGDGAHASLIRGAIEGM